MASLTCTPSSNDIYTHHTLYHRDGFYVAPQQSIDITPPDTDMTIGVIAPAFPRVRCRRSLLGSLIRRTGRTGGEIMLPMSSTAIRVLLVDDQPLLRESVLNHLRSVLPVADVCFARSGMEALQHGAEQPVDLLIAELFLTDMHAFVLLQRLHDMAITPITILFACGATAEIQLSARRLQVRALLNKRIDGARLEEALRAALAGERIYEAFQPHGRHCGYNSGSLDLTPREFDVLLYLARGLSNKQIESALTMSASTLKTHLRSLFDKFAVSNRTACLVSARQAGFL